MARPKRSWPRIIAAAVAVLVGVLCASAGAAVPAGAHPIGQSTLELTGSGGASRRITGILTMPATRLDIVLGTHLAGNGVSTPDMKLTTANAQVVAAYVESRVAIRSGSTGEAQPWTTTWSEPTLVDLDGLAQVRFRLTASPPSGGDSVVTHAAGSIGPAAVTISAIVEEIRTHDVIVSTRPSGRGQYELAGIADFASRTVDISGALLGATPAGVRDDRANGVVDALGSSLRLGWSHLWSGADHVIFLLLLGLGLMVPAANSARPSASRLARRVVIASVGFTIGHGISLAAVTSGVLDPPTRAVETAIAVTIGLTAAVLLSGRLSRVELLLIPIFGLIHGFGFAGALADAGVESHRLPTLLGFNLGLEAAQLVVLAALLPISMLVGSAGPVARRATRVAAATLGLLIAAGWAIERATGRPNAISSAADAVFGHPPLVVLGLAAIPLGLLAVRAGRLSGRLARWPVQPHAR